MNTMQQAQELARQLQVLLHDCAAHDASPEQCFCAEFREINDCEHVSICARYRDLYTIRFAGYGRIQYIADAEAIAIKLMHADARQVPAASKCQTQKAA